VAILNDVRFELQIEASDISDDSIAYALKQVDNDTDLTCAYVLRMLLNKNRGRRQLTIGSFNESVDVRDIRKRIRYYMNKAAGSSTTSGAGGMIDVEDSDNIFTVDGI